MGHGWYNVVQPMAHGGVRALYGPWVIGGTMLYSPWVMDGTMLYSPWVMDGTTLYNPWAMGDERIVWVMGHGWYNIV